MFRPGWPESLVAQLPNRYWPLFFRVLCTFELPLFLCEHHRSSANFFVVHRMPDLPMRYKYPASS
jgi:hypothetical protein